MHDIIGLAALLLTALCIVAAVSQTSMFTPDGPSTVLFVGVMALLLLLFSAADAGSNYSSKYPAPTRTSNTPTNVMHGH